MSVIIAATILCQLGNPTCIDVGSKAPVSLGSEQEVCDPKEPCYYTKENLGLSLPEQYNCEEDEDYPIMPEEDVDYRPSSSQPYYFCKEGICIKILFSIPANSCRLSYGASSGYADIGWVTNPWAFGSRGGGGFGGGGGGGGGGFRNALGRITPVGGLTPSPNLTPPIIPPATATVPEPATWLMMLLGFAFIGFRNFSVASLLHR